MYFKIESESFSNLQFVSIDNNQCNYLHDRNHNIYYFIAQNISKSQYRTLIDMGFRRMGTYIYKPFCIHCLECQVIRVPLISFKMSKTQRRIFKKYYDKITYRISKPFFSLEKLSMYYKYISRVHSENLKEESLDNLFIINQLIENPYYLNQNDYKNLQISYESFFIQTCLEDSLTWELQIYIDDHLIGIGIFDLIDDGWSSVYFFYDPDYSYMNPGTLSCLLEIELAKERNLSYYYLGYYIEKSPKMNYKKNFKPYELKRFDEKNYQFFIK